MCDTDEAVLNGILEELHSMGYTEARIEYFLRTYDPLLAFDGQYEVLNFSLTVHDGKVELAYSKKGIGFVSRTVELANPNSIDRVVAIITKVLHGSTIQDPHLEND